MDKPKMHTLNRADENYRKLAELFPNAVTETIDETTGEVVRAIDKDVLMQEISTTVVDGNEERYQFTWPDKKKSILLANAPTSKTLRPCREESVNFDNTENLYKMCIRDSCCILTNAFACHGATCALTGRVCFALCKSDFRREFRVLSLQWQTL